MGTRELWPSQGPRFEFRYSARTLTAVVSARYLPTLWDAIRATSGAVDGSGPLVDGLDGVQLDGSRSSRTRSSLHYLRCRTLDWRCAADSVAR